MLGINIFKTWYKLMVRAKLIMDWSLRYHNKCINWMLHILSRRVFLSHIFSLGKCYDTRMCRLFLLWTTHELDFKFLTSHFIVAEMEIVFSVDIMRHCTNWLIKSVAFLYKLSAVGDGNNWKSRVLINFLLF